jgi:hypothetical protein
MAVHDNERRTPRDYMHNARTRYDDTGAAGKWIAFMVGIGLIAMVVFIFAAGTDTTDTTSDAIRQTPQNPTTTTAPRTTTPAPTGPTTQPK